MELISMRDRATLLALGLSILAHVLLLFGLSTKASWKGIRQVSIIYVDLKLNATGSLSTTPDKPLPVALPMPIVVKDYKTDSEDSKGGSSLQPVAKPIDALIRQVPELEKITEHQELTPENLEDYCRNRSKEEADRYVNQHNSPNRPRVPDPCILS